MLKSKLLASGRHQGPRGHGRLRITEKTNRMRLARTLLTTLLALLLVFPAMQVLASGTPPPPPGTNPREVQIKVFLQGLYDSGTGEMRKTRDYNTETEVFFDRYHGVIADKVLIELHEAGSYGTPVQVGDLVASGWVDLLQDGTAYFDLSKDFQGDYYITVKSRNHIETVSAVTVTFAGEEKVEYNFTTSVGQAYSDPEIAAPAQANLGGVYGIWAGDIPIADSQDGVIDGDDLGQVVRDLRAVLPGYNDTDLTGTGLVDGDDLGLVVGSLRAVVARQLPE